MQNKPKIQDYVKDAVLLSLHAARACGLREDALFMMLPLINCRNVCAAQFRKLLNRMTGSGLIAQTNGAFKIMPDGLIRLRLMELI